MRIVINGHSLLGPLTGIGKYTYCLSQALEKIDGDIDVEYFYCSYSKHLRHPEESVTVAEVAGRRLKVKLFARDVLKIATEVVRKHPRIKTFFRTARYFIAQLTMKKFDVYFEPCFIPLNIAAKFRVVTVADFSFHTHPECHPQERLDHFKKHFWKKIKSADHIIFISDFIRRYAIETFDFPEDKSSTIHLGVLHSQFRQMSAEEIGDIRKRLQLPESFVLFVGSLEPRKNLSRIMKAYLSLPQSVRNEVKMIIVGGSGWENDDIQKLIDTYPDEIKHLGYLSDEDLPKVYNLASLFVFTTLYEGFGLPALEAMACGCPVLTSNTTSLPEICGEAADLVDPLDQNAIRDGLLRILTDQDWAEQLKKRGLAHAQQFTWEKCAREHLKVFRGEC